MSPAQATPLNPRARAGGLTRERLVGRVFPEGGFDYDVWLLGCTAVIIAVGLIMVSSASTSIATDIAGTPDYFLRRQLFALGLALAVGMFVLRVPIAMWQRLSMAALLAAFVLLLLVLVDGIGHEVNGSRRWLQLGPLAMQASEPAKLALVVYLAGYLTRHQDQVATEFVGFIKPIGVLTALSALLLLEPDFGSSAVLFATGFGMLFLGGVPLGRFLLWSVAAFTTLLVVAALAPYRMARLTGFLNPWENRYDSGFQLTQALIAFGRGEWFGLGLGNGIQKLFYLPEAHTDFVFAVVGEELGLLGTLGLVVLFTMLVWRVLYLASLARRRGAEFAAHVGYGVGLLIGIQAFVNMGVAMGVLPTKGLTLPLVSYGNNSLLVTCAALAMVLRLAHELELRAPTAPAANNQEVAADD